MSKKDSEKEEVAKEEKKEAKALSPEECQELLAKVEELETMKDQMLRSAADFENAKKRLAREKEEFVKFAKESLILDLLGILDNFERALLHADEDKPENLKNVISGIQMVFKQLNEILKGQGLNRLETKDQQFDPNLHEAIGYVREEGQEDQIIDEIEPGYKLHDRLLRAAKVRVRMAPSSEEEASNDSN